jgi:hypothetical protein
MYDSISTPLPKRRYIQSPLNIIWKISNHTLKTPNISVREITAFY